MKNKYWQLFRSFFVIGALTFGGGYSMLPMMQRELIEKHAWCSEEDLVDYFAVAQSIPGLIATNTATFVGRKVAGIWGSVVSVLGVALPSFVVISILASVLKAAVEIPMVAHAFAGIRVAVSALILVSVLKIWKSGVKDLFGILLFAVAIIAMFIFKPSPILCVAGGIVIGIVAGFVKRRAMK